MGINAAYAHKLKTGQGQRVDTSLFEAGIIQTYWQSAIAFATGVSPGPLGSAHPLSAPYQAFETKRRLDHARRLQPEDLGPVPRGARRARGRQRSPLCRQCRPHGEQAAS